MKKHLFLLAVAILTCFQVAAKPQNKPKKNVPLTSEPSWEADIVGAEMPQS